MGGNGRRANGKNKNRSLQEQHNNLQEKAGIGNRTWLSRTHWSFCETDDNKYKAIKEFLTPKNLKYLRSFLGLANQLAAFVPDLALMSAGLRPLLKKGNAWVWEKEHEKEFNNIKNLLISPTIAKPFDDSKETILLTDASTLHDLGYALIQKSRKGELLLIQCGSRSLTPTQQRYTTIELECLAIVWAIQKCDYGTYVDFRILTYGLIIDLL